MELEKGRVWEEAVARGAVAGDMEVAPVREMAPA